MNRPDPKSVNPYSTQLQRLRLREIRKVKEKNIKLLRLIKYSINGR